VTLALVTGALVGLGSVLCFRSFRTVPPTLEWIAGVVERMPGSESGPNGRPRISQQAGKMLESTLQLGRWTAVPRWVALGPALAITGESANDLASKMLVGGGIGLIGPPALWLALQAAGFSMDPWLLVAGPIVAAPLGLILPPASLLNRARDRRRHFRFVVGSFVDLVALSLAGGVGIEGALLSASLVSNDWAAKRLARALTWAREAGQSPWASLGQLGEETGVSELVELATVVELAGAEGARIRQSLSSRAATFRRHEQAEAESAANAMTERLFLPGTLLLVGFLLFIGYPAVSRILGGV